MNLQTLHQPNIEHHSNSVYGWDNDIAVQPAGPCTSPKEAFVKVLGELERKFPDLERRDNWWQHRWKSAWQRLPVSDLDQAAKACNTDMGTLKLYLDAIADPQNRKGDNPIYLKRETIGEKIRRSASTVARCRKAAILLGFQSEGIQLRWKKADTDDEWCGGPSMFILTIPSFAEAASRLVKNARVARRQRYNDYKRKAIVRAGIERREKADREARRRVEESIVESPTSPKPSYDLIKPSVFKEDLSKIREFLNSS